MGLCLRTGLFLCLSVTPPAQGRAQTCAPLLASESAPDPRWVQGRRPLFTLTQRLPELSQTRETAVGPLSSGVSVEDALAGAWNGSAPPAGPTLYRVLTENTLHARDLTVKVHRAITVSGASRDPEQIALTQRLFTEEISSQTRHATASMHTRHGYSEAFVSRLRALAPKYHDQLTLISISQSDGTLVATFRIIQAPFLARLKSPSPVPKSSAMQALDEHGQSGSSLIEIGNGGVATIIERATALEVDAYRDWLSRRTLKGDAILHGLLAFPQQRLWNELYTSPIYESADRDLRAPLSSAPRLMMEEILEPELLRRYGKPYLPRRAIPYLLADNRHTVLGSGVAMEFGNYWIQEGLGPQAFVEILKQVLSVLTSPSHSPFFHLRATQVFTYGDSLSVRLYRLFGFSRLHEDSFQHDGHPWWLLSADLESISAALQKLGSPSEDYRALIREMNAVYHAWQAR